MDKRQLGYLTPEVTQGGGAKYNATKIVTINLHELEKKPIVAQTQLAATYQRPGYPAYHLQDEHSAAVKNI